MAEKILTERRVANPQDVELRVTKGEDGVQMLTGYAAKFNRDSEDLGGFIERIRPGAFTDAIKTSDVRALVNHDPSQLLGRSTSGTLRLIEDKIGLRFEVDLPDTQVARDTAASIERGDMSGCSFAFCTQSDEWHMEDGRDVRELIAVDPLFDVGPVTYPAYPDTTVAARSLDAWRASQDEEGDEEGEDDIEDDAGIEAAMEPEALPVDAREYQRKYNHAGRILNRTRMEIKRLTEADA